MNARALTWEVDGRDWPHRERSRFVEAAGLRWHVQRWPRLAPTFLLLHGTGASTHSWRDVAPVLARHFDVIAVDLPGHAFTATPAGGAWSLPEMAAGLQGLLLALNARPALVAGHSAGAAIAVRMSLDRRMHPRVLYSLNGALLPLGGLPGQLFSPIARMLAAGDWMPRWFARRAQNPSTVDRLLEGTGSKLDERGRALYQRLVSNPVHAAGALSMMARWDLAPLRQELPRLQTRLHLIVGSADGTVPPEQSRRVMDMVPSAGWHVLTGLGHLAHEEAPEEVAELMLRIAQAEGMQLNED